jgi:hypothetical protein
MHDVRPEQYATVIRDLIEHEAEIYPGCSNAPEADKRVHMQGSAARHGGMGIAEWEGRYVAAQPLPPRRRNAMAERANAPPTGGDCRAGRRLRRHE